MFPDPLVIDEGKGPKKIETAATPVVAATWGLIPAIRRSPPAKILFVFPVPIIRKPDVFNGRAPSEPIPIKVIEPTRARIVDTVFDMKIPAVGLTPPVLLDLAVI